MVNNSSSLTYPPVLRIEGRTSDVTQCLNLCADSSLLPKIKAYKPDSLITTKFCFPEGVSISFTPLSSSKIWSLTAFCGLVYPSAIATSFPTNQGSSLIINVLTYPNSSFLKICN